MNYCQDQIRLLTTQLTEKKEELLKSEDRVVNMQADLSETREQILELQRGHHSVSVCVCACVCVHGCESICFCVCVCRYSLLCIVAYMLNVCIMILIFSPHTLHVLVSGQVPVTALCYQNILFLLTTYFIYYFNAFPMWQQVLDSVQYIINVNISNIDIYNIIYIIYTMYNQSMDFNTDVHS